MVRLSVGVFLFLLCIDEGSHAFLSPESLVVNCGRASVFEHRQSTPGGGGTDGPRPVGRNRDADSVSNKADVYFAQLKLDSRIRKQAFLNGDTENSNKVFGDERVRELGEYLQKDPQIKSRQEQAFETSAEEMIALMASTSSEETSTQPVKQISYKEKLLAAKNRKLTGDQRVATQPSQSDPVQVQVSATSSLPPPAVSVDHIPTAVTPPSSTGPVSDEVVTSAIEYAAATIQMYKLAPDSQKPALTQILRSALTTAVAKLDA
jgi:hypothetical protein